MGKNFYNIIKYSTSLLVILLSYLYYHNHKDKNSFNASDPYFIAWIVVAITSTLYSICWDVKVGFGLFEKGAPHRFLRKDLVY